MSRRSHPPRPRPRRSSLGPWRLALLAACPLAACEPNVQNVPVRIELPEESSELETADNLSLVLDPEGVVAQYDVDGLDFVVSLEIEAPEQVSTLSVYLAQATELLAWGRSDAFIPAGSVDTLAVFLGRAGTLSTLKGAITAPDAELMAAQAPGRGVLLVDGAGETALFRSYTWSFAEAAPLDPVPPVGEGALLPDLSGGVTRLSWETQWFASRYDPAADFWLLSLAPAPALRPGAALLPAPAGDRVYLLGGGGRLDGTAVALLPDAGGELETATISAFDLDRPRDGATALWLPRPSQSTDRIVVVGGEDPGPLVWSWPDGAAAGSPSSWTGARCILPLEGESRVWCAGGLVDGAATARLVEVDLGDPATPAVTIYEDLFPVPVRDPGLWVDSGAVYAQAEGLLWRLEPPEDAGVPPSPVEIDAGALRATGGYFIRLGSGATFLAGGVTAEGTPVDRWQVFTPDPPAP